MNTGGKGYLIVFKQHDVASNDIHKVFTHTEAPDMWDGLEVMVWFFLRCHLNYNFSYYFNLQIADLI
ncbi:hypothetical protein ID850_01525 [Xenorhabdus sp. Flor]|uniref:hypothetical protein n=1 Tax=Xenorhabdus cabanillasii TaxID=351673 RepID=UPI001995C85C|nr:hypothetical protein [Xenorhabdus sp. Flor]MBD2813468.1 hypothetical protein [Xenorhabdus sp. Flor]